MENQRTSPELSDSHYLRDAIETNTAKKEYSKWISTSAKRLVEEHASFGKLRLGYGRDFGKFYSTQFYENWNVGVYSTVWDRFGQTQRVHLNLTEQSPEDQIFSVITLAKINLITQKVIDTDGNKLSFEQLRKVHTTLEQLLHHAEQS